MPVPRVSLSTACVLSAMSCIAMAAGAQTGALSIREAHASLPGVRLFYRDTGGSGVAMGLPENFRRAGLLALLDDPAALDDVAGPAAVLAGSCSRATLGQKARRYRVAHK